MRNAFDPHCDETGPNALRPELMSDAERLDEAAEILARGVVRLRQRREGRPTPYLASAETVRWTSAPTDAVMRTRNSAETAHE
jgi:hypothetical protein